ncbi:MAG: hypothetical protein HDR88_18515 [Bacteroides sp.]|nr:hypothetical protein [Bacteroides sp.]
MRKTLLMLTMVMAVVSFAAPLTPQEALESAIGRRRHPSPAFDSPGSYSLCWQATNNGIYVFAHDNGGFIIASGDTDCPPLLGYSDNSKFDPNSIPYALEAFLIAIDSAITNGKGYRVAATRSDKVAITPLLTTKWNQDEPYNNLCPKIHDQHCFTGCAATAMAQVIKYWEYPTNPIGQISYNWFSGGQKLSYDFMDVTFDWKNMLDDYDENATTTQNDAVARLMLACGMASQMDYTDLASGTTDVYAGLGMVNHFGYDRSIKLLFRDFYRIREWNDMVYNELAAGRPVLYYGFSPVGGHAFVCDGYEGGNGDYFHINWGWGGLSDGYFLINGLNPEYIGLGGSIGGFNIMQSAFFGLEPAKETSSEFFHQVLCFGYFATEKMSYTKGNRILFGLAGGYQRVGFYNMSLENIYFTPGLKLTPINGGESIYFPATTGANIKPEECMETFNVDSSDFPEGTYRINPAYRIGESDTWVDMPEETQIHTKIIMVIDDDIISINTTDDSDGLIVNDFSVSPTVFKANKEVSINLDFMSYNLDERIILTPTLISPKGYIISQGEAQAIDAVAGERGCLNWNTTFTPTPEPGSYLLGLLNPKTQLITDAISVVVTDENIENEFMLSTMRFNRALASKEFNTISGETLSVSCKLELKAGYFDGDVITWIYNSDNEPILPLADAKSITLGPGASQTLFFKGSISDLNPEAIYGIGLIVTDKDGTETQVGDIYPFTAPNASEVKTLTTECSEQDKFVTLQGFQVKKPSKGDIVIRVSNGKATKIIVK